MDLFDETVVLLPRGAVLGSPPANVAGVAAVDRIAEAPAKGEAPLAITGWGQSSVQTAISWAAKPFLIWMPQMPPKPAPATR
jgi:hypothetical protein